MDSCLRRIFLQCLDVDLEHSEYQVAALVGAYAFTSWRIHLNPYAR
jgi:hypothetical protein